MVGQDTPQLQNASFNPFDPYAAGQQLGRDMTGQTTPQNTQPSAVQSVSENISSTVKWLVIGGVVLGGVWLYAALRTADSNVKMSGSLLGKFV